MSENELPGFLDLFENRAFSSKPEWSGCYCQFYLDDPNSTKPDDLTSERNRDTACSRVRSGQMTGYVAYLGESCVGWCAAGSANNYPAFPKVSNSLARVLCFVIDENHRGQGISTELLNFAVKDLEAQGFERIEAAPSAQSEDQAGNYHGPLSMYLNAGFVSGDELENGQVLVVKDLKN